MDHQKPMLTLTTLEKIKETGALMARQFYRNEILRKVPSLLEAERRAARDTELITQLFSRCEPQIRAHVDLVKREEDMIADADALYWLLDKIAHIYASSIAGHYRRVQGGKSHGCCASVSDRFR